MHLLASRNEPIYLNKMLEYIGGELLPRTFTDEYIPLQIQIYQYI